MEDIPETQDLTWCIRIEQESHLLHIILLDINDSMSKQPLAVRQEVLVDSNLTDACEFIIGFDQNHDLKTIIWNYDASQTLMCTVPCANETRYGVQKLAPPNLPHVGIHRFLDGPLKLAEYDIV